MTNIFDAQQYLDTTYGENVFVVYTSVYNDGLDVHDIYGNFLNYVESYADLKVGAVRHLGI